MTETREIIPIENVELDIERIADQLFLGPQAELLEKIHNFNTRYGRDITENILQINKNYGFKPGTYDRIKEAYGHYCLGYTSKPKNIWRLWYRIDKNRWKQRDFWRQAIQIQNEMHQIKSNNGGWQDNQEVVENFWNDLKVRIPIEIQNALDIFTKDNIDIGIHNEEITDLSKWCSMRIRIELFISDINMKVIYQDEEIADYEWGNVAVKWYVPLWKFINNWCEGGSRRRSGQNVMNSLGYAKTYPKFPGLSHPYVSGNALHSPNGWISYICLGDMQNDIMEAVWGLNIEALCSLTRSWLSRYHIPRTNPLNRIHKCYYGFEIGMDEKIWNHRDVSPLSEIQNCKWPDKFLTLTNYEGDNPCDICEFKEGYAYLANNHLIPEDAEYPGQNVKIVEPCHKAIVEYECPETDEEIIAEACIMHIMCCSVLRNGSINTHAVEEDLDWRLTDENRFPADANLETIYRLNETFNFSSAFRNEQSNWPVRNSLDLLDAVFNTRIWHDLVDEYIDLHELDEGAAEDASYDLRNESIQRIREMIENEIQRRAIVTDNSPNSEQTPFDPLAEAELNILTPEEQAIRWATQNGRTINI